MGLPTVSNFLFCLTLETGGLVIGWTTAVLSVLGLILVLLVLVAGLATVNVGVIIAAVILALYYFLVLYAAVMLIKGTRNKNYVQLKLFLILMAIGVILSFLQIFTVGVGGIAVAIIYAIVYAYFFICVYSLYQLVKVG